MPVFLDTNVFILAAGVDHPLKEPCVQILRRIALGKLDATTSAEVVQELHHVFRRRGMLSAGITLGRGVAKLIPGLLPVTGADVSRSADLLEQLPQLSPRDALHAATALNNGIGTIVSADRDFAGIDGITLVTPDQT